jgi:hypothetical protein
MDVGSRPLNTSPTLTINTGKDLATGYTTVKSADEYDRARKKK